jgi:hypothetical protein
MIPFDEVPFRQIEFQAIRMVFGMQEFLYRCFVPLRGSGFELIILGSESGTPHQVGHQSNVFLCHLFSSSLCACQ